MLSIQEIYQKIELWETQTSEFKREFTTDPIRESLVAFSNDHLELGGGTIIIGVDPKSKEIVGIEGSADDLMLRITGLCRDGNIVPSLAPDLYPVDIEGKIIVVVEVKKSDRRPHRSNNICYIRVGSSNKKSTPDEEFELIRKSGRIPFDLSPVREASLEDLDFNKFEKEFLPRRLSSDTLALNGRTTIDWLETLKLVYKEGDRLIPTITCLLLFAKNPQDFIPHAYIDFIRFEGDDPSYPILDRKSIGGNLDSQIKIGLELVERYSIQGYKFSERSPVRSDVFEYPTRAIREAIANAVAHRDYEFTRSPISIKMFDDRIEVLSPGGLFGIVTKENFGTGINDYRNSTLAVGLNYWGLVEKAGTGIFLIKRQMRENGSLEPAFEIGDKYLLAKLPAHPYYQAARLYQKGINESEAGDKRIAIQNFDKAVTLFPNFAEAWAALGRLEGQNGNMTNARKSFQTAIEKNPRFEKAYLDWSRAEESNGQKEKGISILRQGLQAIPESWSISYMLGQLEQQNKNLPKASAYFRQALTYQPTNTKILRSLGENALRLRDWNEAIRSFEKVLDIAEPSLEKGSVYLNLMKAYINNNAKHDVVERCFKQAYEQGFRAHELFSQYYRYLTRKQLHSEALAIVDIAQKEGYQLTPDVPEVTIGNINRIIPAREIINEISDLLRHHGLAFSSVIYNPKIMPIATIKTFSEAEADAIVQVLEGIDFHSRRLTARRK